MKAAAVLLGCVGVSMAFDYATPHLWKEGSPLCGSGLASEKQSPIDIPELEPGMPSYAATSVPINYTFLPIPALTSTLKNNGHSIKFTAAGMGTMTGGILPPNKTYVSDHGHFHWPSEHTLYGQSMPLEMHVVHYNSAHPDVGTAAPTERGLAVFTLFFELGEPNPELQKLIDLVPQVVNYSSTTEIPVDFNLNAMIPHEASTHFVTYQGSLTTPPCLETVTFLLITEPATVSQAQLDALLTLHTNLKDATNQSIPMTINNRPVQPLNGRQIFHFEEVEPVQAAAVAGGNLGLIMTALEVVGVLVMVLLLAGFIHRGLSFGRRKVQLAEAHAKMIGNNMDADGFVEESLEKGSGYRSVLAH